MAGPPCETFTLRLEVAGRRTEGRVALPSEPVPVTAMLPVVHAVADAVVRLTGETLAEGGTPITCGPGCAACCRKLVPISATEARRLRALVDALPEERRAVLRARFDAAGARLDAAGLLPRLDRDGLSAEEVVDLSGPYFELWLDCPFLEEERCAIYAERPAACREYLVVSPPAACFPDSPEANVDRVRLPRSVSNALSTLEPAGWIPLIRALERAGSLPAEPAPRPGGAWLQAVLDGSE